MERQNEQEIDLLALFLYLRKKIWVLAISFVLCAVVGFSFTKIFLQKEYTTVTRMYVLNQGAGSNVAVSDLQLSNLLMEDYKVLITGENVMKEVIRRLDLDMSVGQLSKKIKVNAMTNTRVVEIKITDTDPQRAADIANCVREVSSKQIQQIMDAVTVNVVYEAAVPEEASGPSTMKNTVLAAMVGLVIAVGVYTVIYLVDDTIRTEEDVERYLGLSTLGVIPVSDEFEKMSRSNPRQSENGKTVRRKPTVKK